MSRRKPRPAGANGRPRADADYERLELLGVRITPATKRAIERRAKAAGLTASAWSAEQLTRALGAPDA